MIETLVSLSRQDPHVESGKDHAGLSSTENRIVRNHAGELLSLAPRLSSDDGRWFADCRQLASVAVQAAALAAPKGRYTVEEDLTPEADVTGYNNFYEFGTGKADPAANSDTFKPTPWTVKVDGLVGKPKEFGLEELLALPIEERVYRMRCVEAWSMVIPWTGFPLAALLDKVEPLGNAKYVSFETVVRPEEMPGQSGFFQALPWPYREGLRLDEARHPLTILSVGVYGKTLPNQNGAPIRLVTPWKYGFKGIKSIVRISFDGNAAAFDMEPVGTQ